MDMLTFFRTAARVAVIILARLTVSVLPGKVVVLFKENLRLVRRMDYASRDIFLNIESGVEYHVRLHSCAKEPETIQWIQEYVKPGDVFFDVGANVGAYSLVAAKTTDGKAKIYAFEPAFPNYAQLCRNVFLNNCAQSIVPLPVALSDRTGLDMFNYRTMISGGAHHAYGKAIDFRSDPFDPIFQQGALGYRLDDFISQYSIPPLITSK